MSDKSDNSNRTSLGHPAPEVLHAQSDEKATASEVQERNGKNDKKPHTPASARGAVYRPSHKATFIGVAVVIAILVINVGVITFLMQTNQNKDKTVNRSEVTISPAVLNTLGVSHDTIGSADTQLTVGPDSSFNGKVTIGGDLSVGGQFKLNSQLIGTSAKFNKLEAGETSLEKLNVNGDGTLSSLNLRKDLSVVGTSRLQGPVIVSQLFTVNNNMNVAGSLSVGGTLSIRNFQTNTLSVSRIGTIGSAPSCSKGGALAGTDTVSISGNDMSGTVAVNIGVGSRSGIVANITFTSKYGSTPHVIITPVGSGVSDFYINRTSTGFSIGVGSISSGGHAFDYVVVQ